MIFASLVAAGKPRGPGSPSAPTDAAPHGRCPQCGRPRSVATATPDEILDGISGPPGSLIFAFCDECSAGDVESEYLGRVPDASEDLSDAGDLDLTPCPECGDVRIRVYAGGTAHVAYCADCGASPADEERYPAIFRMGRRRRQEIAETRGNRELAVIVGLLELARWLADNWLSEHAHECRCVVCRTSDGHVHDDMTVVKGIAGTYSSMIGNAMISPSCDEHATYSDASATLHHQLLLIEQMLDEEEAAEADAGPAPLVVAGS